MLKHAEAADVASIVAFEAEVMDVKLYGKSLDHTAAAAEIAANDYYMSLDSGRVVATGALRRRDDGTVYLSNIAVHPDARRKGHARAMMNHLMSLCGDSPSVALAVHPENDAARALYAAMGFLPTHVRENFFGDGEPRLMMQFVTAQPRGWPRSSARELTQSTFGPTMKVSNNSELPP